MSEQTNMATRYEREIPEGYEARIEGNKVIFELKESEDDRIRKAISYAIGAATHQDGTLINDVTKDEALAYLEKQKEQKPEHTAKEAWKKMRRSVLEQTCGNCHEPNYADASTKMFSLCDIDEIFEKIGDSTVGSQPAEWSDEDKVMLNNIIWSVHMKSIMPLDEMDDRSKYKKYENFLNSLPERFNLQSKQEWNEEDEKMLNGIIERGNSEIPKGECGLTPNQVAWLETRLKSIRPQLHWKPSEEQMGALMWQIKNTSEGSWQRKESEDLYNYLKKL